MGTVSFLPSTQLMYMTLVTSTSIIPNACILCHLVIFQIKPKPIYKWTMSKWPFNAHKGPFEMDLSFIWKICYLFDLS